MKRGHEHCIVMIYKQLTAYNLRSPEQHETGTPGEHSGVGCIVEHLGGPVAGKHGYHLQRYSLYSAGKKIPSVFIYIPSVCRVAHRLDLAVLMRLAGLHWSLLLMS